MMAWTFRILAALNGVMLAIAFLYHSPGEDAAGAGMRIGFATFYVMALAVVLSLYHFIRTPWVRIPMLVLLCIPLLSIAYGMWLSV